MREAVSEVSQGSAEWVRTVRTRVAPFASGFVVACLLLWAVAPRMAGAGQPPKIIPMNNADVMRGLKGVGIVVSVADGAKTVGVTEEKVRDMIEQKFRRSGIKILSGQELRSAAGRPYLYVDVVASTKLYSISMEFSEDVRLERDNTITVGSAATWARKGAGLHDGDPEVVVNHVAKQVDDFCKDFAKANARGGGGSLEDAIGRP